MKSRSKTGPPDALLRGSQRRVGEMLNILPGVTGLFVARHLKISYSAALDLAYIASGTVSNYV